MIRVLMIDDDKRQAVALMKKLINRGFIVSLVSSAVDLKTVFEKESFDVVLIDTRLSDLHDLGLFKKLRYKEPKLQIIVYTSYVSVDSAVRFMKCGAFDYLAKPCECDKLIDVIRKAVNKKENVKAIKPQIHSEVRSETDTLVGQSEAMRNVRDLIGLVAPSQAPVLILGETGTGKELVARAIHDQSPRRGTPLVVVNASALQESILESELFGYKKGAFTGAFSDKKGLLEIAHNGTCFIDEIGDMGINIQTKILRVVETGVFMKLGDTRETKTDIRFLFATNNDLASSMEYGSFRKDLFYRISALTMKLPSLKERKGDIILLTNHFLARFSQYEKYLSKEAVNHLTAYDWPGNVRELANAIQRAVLMSGAREMIDLEDLPENIIKAASTNEYKGYPLSSELSDLAVRQGENISKVMDFAEGNKTKAARLLGASRNTLNRKIVLRGA